MGRSGSSDYFNGLIDDVRIYSRALTAYEVQTLYAQTKDNYLARE
ncbi:MAG: LamG-like jellyroll fold domain-containing protein [Minisyncoccales bacterium]